MTKEAIKKSIDYILEGAWENPQQAQYHLEKLPMEDCDYDVYVHAFITKIAYYVRMREKENFEIVVDDLIEYYFINQCYYSEFN